MAYKDPEVRKAKDAAYRHAHKEESGIYQKMYREAHRAQRLLAFRAWHAAHRDEANARRKAEYEANKEREREYRRLYRLRHLQEEHAHSARRRAQKAGVPSERIERQRVYNRDKGICGICRRRVSVKQFSIDHIIPLARGGHHRYTNVQIAHPICNSRKQDVGIGQPWLLGMAE